MSPADLLLHMTTLERFQIDFRDGSIEIVPLDAALRPADLRGLCLPLSDMDTGIWWRGESQRERLATQPLRPGVTQLV